jgi:hypothetical protein
MDEQSQIQTTSSDKEWFNIFLSESLKKIADAFELEIN